MSFRARATSSALRTKERATKSTPTSRPNLRSSTSFSVKAGARKATPGTLMPLCSSRTPPRTTRARTSPGPTAVTESSSSPSARRMRSPRVDLPHELRVRGGQPLGCSPLGVRGDHHLPSFLQHHGAVVYEGPHADLGPLQVLQHRHGAAQLRARPPDRFDAAPVLFPGPVGEVEAHDVHARLHEGTDPIRVPRGRSHRGHNLRPPPPGWRVPRRHLLLLCASPKNSMRSGGPRAG
jgi:hypothetical protein